MPFPQYKVIELSTLSIPSEKLTLLAAMTAIFLFLSFLIAFIFKSSVSAANPIEKTLYFSEIVFNISTLCFNSIFKVSSFFILFQIKPLV